MDGDTDLYQKIEQLEKLVKKHEYIFRLLGFGLALGGFTDSKDEELSDGW